MSATQALQLSFAFIFLLYYVTAYALTRGQIASELSFILISVGGNLLCELGTLPPILRQVKWMILSQEVAVLSTSSSSGHMTAAVPAVVHV